MRLAFDGTGEANEYGDDPFLLRLWDSIVAAWRKRREDRQAENVERAQEES